MFSRFVSQQKYIVISLGISAAFLQGACTKNDQPASPAPVASVPVVPPMPPPAAPPAAPPAPVSLDTLKVSAAEIPAACKLGLYEQPTSARAGSAEWEGALSINIGWWLDADLPKTTADATFTQVFAITKPEEMPAFTFAVVHFRDVADAQKTFQKINSNLQTDPKHKQMPAPLLAQEKRSIAVATTIPQVDKACTDALWRLLVDRVKGVE